MSEAILPVVIIGGGPVGLTTALLLARAQISSVLIERHPSTSLHPKARLLNVRTMEIYRSAQLEQAIHTAGFPVPEDRPMIFAQSLEGEEYYRVPFSLLNNDPYSRQLSPCLSCYCAQHQLEPILVDALRQQGNATLLFNTELVELEQDGSGVTAYLRDRVHDTTRSLRAQYLVAADGANSSVRQLFGIGMPGRVSLGHLNTIFFRADLSQVLGERKMTVCFIENAQVYAALMPFNDHDLWSCHILSFPGKSEKPFELTQEQSEALLRSVVGRSDIPFEVISALGWEAATGIAEHLQKGRVFLVGDAAHSMPTYGGFGLNTGIQDAHNLAWKLIAVLKGQAAPSLLQTYTAERYPVIQFTVDYVGRASQAVNKQQTSDHIDHHQQTIEQHLYATLLYKYQSAAIVDIEQETEVQATLSSSQRYRAFPGMRAPHLWLEREGQRLSLLDLFGDQFVLLTTGQGKNWHQAVQQLPQQINGALRVYCITGPDLGEGDYTDPTGTFCKIYRITPTGAVLVRPDGFVGWVMREGSASPVISLKQTMSRLLCSQEEPSRK